MSGEKPADGCYNILYVDDEIQNLYLFRSFFEQQYNVLTAESGTEALAILSQKTIQVLFVDQRMSGMNGIQLLETVAVEYPDTVRVLVTGYSDIDVVIDAINRGSVYRYLSKPWDLEEVAATIRNAVEIYELKRKNESLIDSLDRQNKLLLRKVEELAFINELQIELKGFQDLEGIVTKVIERLRGELDAEAGFFYEKSGQAIQLRSGDPVGQKEQELAELVDRIGNLDTKDPYVHSLPEGGGLLILPLVFSGLFFGFLVFLFSRDKPFSQEDLPFTKAASHVAASVLYSRYVQKEEMKKQRLLMLGQMAGMIVHDLKGPLATIMGFVSLLQADIGPAEREEFGGIINREVRRLIDMIEELLSFSKGETYLDISSIDLHSLIDEILELFHISLRKENIATKISLNGLHSFPADRKKMKKVFINLFQNAREYLQNVEGQRRIQIESTLHGDTVQIRFINNGPKIPPDVLQKLFDPFFSHNKDQGTGLGLTICKKIVEEHHGSIEVESEAGRNEFRITLPARSGSYRDL